MLKKSLFYIFFALSLFGVMGVSFISDKLERSPVMSCNMPYGFFQTKNAKYYTYPDKIVIQPWRGPHHTYAVFQIPNGYQHEYLFRLKIPKEPIHCGGLAPVEQNVLAGIPRKQGYYLTRGYLNTRIALNLIFQGKINQLKQPQNWRLGYVKQ
ncbi:unknown protein [Nostoc sp. NIES-3756]|uniref:hypothetical protein n=1 Tax=Nostoc sp. NIES-3756 TaxID=1751286 RepID=UPI000722DC82|nr:hypothetical protein [Nostoc sp. NIES-3756]BAT54227.1 unknown protein [Nostoc sp. NIES-3756]